MRTQRSLSLLALLVLACLPLGYEAHANVALLVPPSVPTVVKVGFYLSDINDVDEQNETFEFEGQLISTWNDPRLAFDPDIVGTSEKNYVGHYQFEEVFTGWWPQFVLSNESGHFEIHGVMVRIRADGQVQMIQELTAVAEMPMALRRFPFDAQSFTANFLVLGYQKSEVLLEPDFDHTGRDDDGVQIAQWNLTGIKIEVDTFRPHLEGDLEPEYSRFVAQLEMNRLPHFMLRIVVFPLSLLCLLCASVFWMDHESLGDRMSISFTGLLTVVAYQFLIGGRLPTIAYFTLMDGFLYSTYAFVAGTILINLRVDHLNRTGRHSVGDRLDERCRWFFPLGFLGVNALLAFAFFVF